MQALEIAIKATIDGNVIPPTVAHERVKKMYTWGKVAARTEKVMCGWSFAYIIDLERIQMQVLLPQPIITAGCIIFYFYYSYERQLYLMHAS